MDELVAITEARGLLKRLRIDCIPVDVVAIAGSLGFNVRESDNMAPGEAGQLFTIGGNRHIVINSKDSSFRQRFTVLHEIAHEVLGLPSNHGNAITASELEQYVSRPKEEVLCDVFAAECLVPWKLLLPMTHESNFDAETIERFSDVFQASRPCVASRFAQASQEMLAYVLSENGVVRYVASSQSLRESRVWIGIGSKIPTVSAAALSRRNQKDVAEASLDGSDWSSSDSATQLYCDEEAVALHAWDQVLSLLTFEQKRGVSSTAHSERNEDRELLPELTGQLPWPKR